MRGITAVTVVLVLTCAAAGGAASAPTVMGVRFDESKAFAFPNLILGTQEEVFTLSYLSDRQLDGYRGLGLSLLRYPCGTPSDWFAWDDVENGYWPSDFEKNRKKLYPDDYIALCRKLGLEPLITVNTTLAGPHDQKNRINPTRVESIRKGAAYAAKWVDHANVQGKAGVRYWEIGNEVWIWMKEDEYPVHVREYAAAMRKVDPSIKIIACGSTGDQEYQPVWLKFPDDPEWKGRPVNRTEMKRWTQSLLRDAKGSFDYLAPHMYVDGDSLDPVRNGRSLFASIDDHERVLQQQIGWIREANSPVRLAMTEWMINWHFQPDIKGILRDNKTLSQQDFEQMTPANSPLHEFITVLGSADFLGKMIATGYIDIAVAHSITLCLGAVWDWTAQKAIDPMVVKPAGVAIEFWSQFKGQNVVPVTLSNVPTYEHEGKTIPLVTAYATTREGQVNLILINRSPDQTITLAAPAVFKAQPAKAVTEHAIEADSWGASIWPAVGHPDKYPFRKTSRALPLDALGRYELRPCKLVRLAIDF